MHCAAAGRRGHPCRSCRVRRPASPSRARVPRDPRAVARANPWADPRAARPGPRPAGPRACRQGDRLPASVAATSDSMRPSGLVSVTCAPIRPRNSSSGATRQRRSPSTAPRQASPTAAPDQIDPVNATAVTPLRCSRPARRLAGSVATAKTSSATMPSAMSDQELARAGRRFARRPVTAPWKRHARASGWR